MRRLVRGVNSKRLIWWWLRKNQNKSFNTKAQRLKDTKNTEIKEGKRRTASLRAGYHPEIILKRPVRLMKMNQQLLKMAYLLIWVMILGFGLPSPSVAQDASPVPKITPLWTVTTKFCSEGEKCGQLWRLSADGEHLFVYIIPTTTMYVFTKGQDNVMSYRVATYPTTHFPTHNYMSQWFDYFPVDDHIILYSDHPSGGFLQRLDLSTGKTQIFGVEFGLDSCLNGWYPSAFDPPIGVFHYLPAINDLLVCRKTSFGYGNNASVFVSTVDLKTGHLTDVVKVGRGDYSYINIVGGRDGSVYLEPGANVKRPDEIRLIMRWNASASHWDRIELPDSVLDNNDFSWPRFMGVDTQSNLYFESDADANIKRRLIITKVNPITKAVQVMKGDQLGWNPYFVGLDADGQMIILNRMTVQSSIINVISRYEFDEPASIEENS
jgi:hypothetical protein